MNIDFKEARRLIMLVVQNNPLGVDYPILDRLFVLKMPDMIIDYGNKLMPLLDEMIKEGILQGNNNGSYIKGPNFPTNF